MRSRFQFGTITVFLIDFSNSVLIVRNRFKTNIFKMPCPVAAAAEAQRVWTSKAQYVDAERKLYSKVSEFHVFIKKKIFFVFFFFFAFSYQCSMHLFKTIQISCSNFIWCWILCIHLLHHMNRYRNLFGNPRHLITNSHVT